MLTDRQAEQLHVKMDMHRRRIETLYAWLTRACPSDVALLRVVKAQHDAARQTCLVTCSCMGKSGKRYMQQAEKLAWENATDGIEPTETDEPPY